MHVNLNRLREALLTMARIGATPRGGVTRLALSDEDRQGRDQLAAWFQEAGLQVRVDDLGNLYGRRAGATPGAPPVVLGSHADSVPKGGKFDGILGVLGALEVVRTLNEHGVGTQHPIEVVSWTNEEGCRFEPPIMCSGVLAGAFTPEWVYARTDRNGKVFGEELERIGYRGLRENRAGAMRAYLELHIEQGPVLEAAGLPVAVVDGIVGAYWLQVTVEGESDHSGPTPMSMRKDALVAAARIITGVRDLAAQLGPDTVTTVGRITADPGVFNVIPGKVVFGVDIRDPQEGPLRAGKEAVQALAERVSRDEKVRITVEQIWYMDPTPFPAEIVETVAAACREQGVPYRHMTSGAGHDAKYMAHIVPTGMIFTSSVNGKSHCEEEETPWDHIGQGANVLLAAALRLALRV